MIDYINRLFITGTGIGTPSRTTIVVVAALVTAAFLSLKPTLDRQRRNARRKGSAVVDTLPGPERHPLFGNVKNFPRSDWVGVFRNWQALYGDVIYMKLPAFDVLVLNSLQDAEELFGKHANVWSARPTNRMVTKEMDFGWSVLFMDTTEGFYETRKIFRKVLGPNVMVDYDHLIDLAADSLIQNLKDFSGDPEQIVKDAVGSVIIKIAYGDKIHREHGEELIKLNGELVESVTYAVSQIWLVNIFPWTRFFPSWTPGITFIEFASKARELSSKVRQWGFSLVQQDMRKEDADFSVISKYLSEPTFTEEYLRDGVAMMYFGGVDTTSSALLNFLSVMLTHPEVQKKIHEELDRVVGKGNRPTAADIPSLKYLDAAWKETLRLISPIPTGVPHVNASDDVWKGVFLPKGTIIVPNISFMLRDPRLWGPDADEFKPERFLFSDLNSGDKQPQQQLPDVQSIPFGFGRRICPGRYMAERNGLMFSASMLAAYEILPPLGDGGPVTVKYTTGQIQ
ncbi:hypothetical protein FRC17_000115 [Serendipita sp. 399]|nr:hypothetical protein FRC17_000115 [Serendipita sp. 399]